MSFYLKRKWDKKPKHIGGVNWSHSAARHLTRAFFFSGGTAVDYARGSVSAIDLANITFEDNKGNFSGLGARNENDIELDSPFAFDNNEGTVICRVASDFTNTNSGIISDKIVDNWDTTGFNLDLRTDNCLLNIGAEGGTSVAHNITDNGNHNLIVQFKAGDLQTLYVDEKELPYVAQAASPTVYPKSAENARIGNYYDGLTSRQWDGSMEFILVFNKKLHIDIAKSLAKNPYQLLQLRNQFIPVIITATTGFQAAWVTQANITMGFK